MADKKEQFRSLSVLIAVACVDMLGFAMIFPLLAFYALDLGIRPTLIGVIMAAFPVAQLLSAPLWGRVSDRYGRRPVLLFGLGASAVSFVIFGFASSFWLLLVSRFVQGAGGGTTGVLHAYVADTVPPEDRTRSLGWLSAATSTGTMIGPVIGSTAALWGQMFPGLVAAFLCLANMAFAWVWLKESSDVGEESRNRRRKPVWHAAWTVLRDPSRIVSRLIWIYALGMLAFSGFTAFVNLYLFDFGIDETNIGYVFLYFGFLAVIMRSLLLGPIVGRFGERWTMRLGAACLLVMFAGAPLAGSLWVLMAWMSLVPIGTALTFPSTTALTSRSADPSELGTIMGTAQAFASSSRIVAPLTATALFEHVGHSVPFFFSALCAAVVVLLSLTVPGRIPGPEEGSEGSGLDVEVDAGTNEPATDLAKPGRRGRVIP